MYTVSAAALGTLLAKSDRLCPSGASSGYRVSRSMDEGGATVMPPVLTGMDFLILS